MTKVFISYSRTDKAFAEKLNVALKEINLDSWIDWDDIPPTADWWDQIQKGIESSDGFLFLLSPDSVASGVCEQEIDHAVKNGKRLVPLVVRDINANAVHGALTKLNWIFFREQDDFGTSLNKLAAGINTDLVWVETHTRLQVRAVEWEKRKDRSLLLRGKDLREAEEQLVNAGQRDPQPTDLQRHYVLESRRGESRTRNGVITIGAAVIVALAVLAFIANNQRNIATDNALTAVANQHVAQTAQADAEQQARLARAGELAAQSVSIRENQLSAALLLGVEAYQLSGRQQILGVLLDNIQQNPYILQYQRSESERIRDSDISPDGKILAYTTGDNTVTLWDMSNNELMAELTSDLDVTRGVSFSPNGKILASIGCELVSTQCQRADITLWTVGAYPTIDRIISGHTDIIDIAFAPNGEALAIVNKDDTITIWDLRVHQSIGQPLKGPSGHIITASFSHDSQILATGGCLEKNQTFDCSMGEIIFWNIQTHQPITPSLVGHSGNITKIVFSPDDKILATAGCAESAESNLRPCARWETILWDTVALQPIGRLLANHLSNITSLAFSPDGTILAEGTCVRPDAFCRSGEINLWDTSTLKLSKPSFRGHTDSVISLQFSSDSETLKSASLDSSVILWHAQSSQPIGLSLMGHSETIYTAAYSPDGKILVSAGGDHKIILWDTETYRPIGQPLTGHSEFVSSVAFSPDGKILASAGGDHKIILWDMETYQPIGPPLQGHTDSVYTISFSQNGELLASASSDTTIIVWDVKSQEPVGQPLIGHLGLITNVAFSIDGTILASGGCTDIHCTKGELIIWDMKTRQLINKYDFPNNAPGLNGLSFSPSGEVLAFVSDDNSISFWDTRTRRNINEPLIGHSDYVTTLDFSSDGKTLASGGCAKRDERNLCIEGEIILWDVQSHQQIGKPLSGHLERITDLVFSPDGNTLASTSHDKTIMLWNINPALWIEKSCYRAGRNFTMAEWALYFPKEEYRKTCEQWPLEPELTVTATP